MALKRYNISLSGSVQGVFFRAFVEAAAKKSGLVGFVRNKTNGSVEIVAEGEEEGLKWFAKQCRTGPPAANVLEIKIREQKATGQFDVFEIRF